MAGTRAAFLEAAAVARQVAASPVVAVRWAEPSALSEMTVGALVAHLARAVTNVERSLEVPEPPSVAAVISAAAYFAAVGPDLDSRINVRVRATSAEEALVGHRAVLGGMDRGLDRLRTRLENEPEGRLVTVRDGEVLPGIGVAIQALVDIAAHHHGQLAVLRALARRERDPDQVLRVI